jgi:hypothetical protein
LERDKGLERDRLSVGGAVERWSGGAVERWSGGAVERWSGGAVERWSGGAVERWSGGAVVVEERDRLSVGGEWRRGTGYLWVESGGKGHGGKGPRWKGTGYLWVESGGKGQVERRWRGTG